MRHLSAFVAAAIVLSAGPALAQYRPYTPPQPPVPYTPPQPPVPYTPPQPPVPYTPPTIYESPRAYEHVQPPPSVAIPPPTVVVPGGHGRGRGDPLVVVPGPPPGPPPDAALDPVEQVLQQLAECLAHGTTLLVDCLRQNHNSVMIRKLESCLNSEVIPADGNVVRSCLAGGQW